MLPLDSHRDIIFSFEIELRSFEMQSNWSRDSVMNAVMKWRHVAAFAALFVCLFGVFEKRRFIRAAAYSLVFALFVELLQGIVETRHAQLQDMCANFFGVYMGAIISYGIREIGLAVNPTPRVSQHLYAANNVYRVRRLS